MHLLPCPRCNNSKTNNRAQINVEPTAVEPTTAGMATTEPTAESMAEPGTSAPAAAEQAPTKPAAAEQAPKGHLR